MAAGVRRRADVNEVPDSESDEEDVNVVNGSRVSAQPIALSDDEDNVASLPRFPVPQHVRDARQPVEELLRSRGVRPHAQWLDSCLNDLAALYPGFNEMPVARQAELCFGQLLMADFNVMGAASLPPSMHSLHATELPGPFVLQVDEITDISHSLRDRYQERQSGRGRTLKLSMTDGIQRVSGMEYRPIKALHVLSPAGMKVSLKNVCIRHGLLMLVPEVLDVLGGFVEHLEAARLRAVQVINKPPRGRRTRVGSVEPSLVERATRAAWPSNSSVGPMAPPENNHQAEQQRSNALSNHAPETQPSNHGSVPAVHHSMRAAVQQEEVHQPMQQDHIAEPMGQPVQVSHIQESSRQQEEQRPPMQRDQSTNWSRQSVQVSGLNSIRLETVQQANCHPVHQAPVAEFQGSEVNLIGLESVWQADHHPVHQAWVAQSNTQSIRISNRHATRLEGVHQVDQGQTLQQGQVAESSWPSVSCTAAETTAVHVSAEPNEQQSSTPTLGRLSLQSRRLTQSNRFTQSKISFSPNMQQPKAHERPLLSPGADHDMPIDLDDSQETEQHTVAVISTLPSRNDTSRESIPFTYLAVLKERSNSQVDQFKVVRGKVKCVITGVVSFQYKDSDEFKLQIHIEDGSSITSAYVQHQLVQSLVGCSPKEVITGLQQPDTHQDMLNNMIRFQKLLERFEGFMDVEFLDTSSVPTILQMTEGVQSTDVKLLLDRVHILLNKQARLSDGLIDLSTP